VAKARRRWKFFASLPERGVRAGAAALGGTVHETFALTLPRFVRRSRFYEATAKNLLRVAIELVGGVERAPGDAPEPSVGELAKRKGAGNVIELGSIAAFGFSPLWLLAAAADVTHGSRVYLNALTQELKAAGVLAEDADAGSVDELLGVLERTSGDTARLIDIPPLELSELRASLVELRGHADSLPSSDEMAAMYSALRSAARTGRCSKYRREWVSPSSLRRGRCRTRMSWPRTVKTGSRYVTKASPRMPAGSASPTAKQWFATSKATSPRRRRGCSTASPPGASAGVSEIGARRGEVRSRRLGELIHHARTGQGKARSSEGHADGDLRPSG
jgi:hypothetical protein